MNGKIHRATVTEANLNYVGSITIDADLLDAAGMAPNEKVQIVNNYNGARFETYIIPGERGSGVICLNGAAARLAQPGDIVIIISYALLTEEEMKTTIRKLSCLMQKTGLKKCYRKNRLPRFCRGKPHLLFRAGRFFNFCSLVVANDRFYVKIVQYGRNGAIIFSQVMLCSAM